MRLVRLSNWTSTSRFDAVLVLSYGVRLGSLIGDRSASVGRIRSIRRTYESGSAVKSSVRVGVSKGVASLTILPARPNVSARAVAGVQRLGVVRLPTNHPHL